MKSLQWRGISQSHDQGGCDFLLCSWRRSGACRGVPSHGAGAAAQTPQRIVSFNLCADQLVLTLADPAQIAGLSPYAGNPALSVVADKGARFPRLDWNAESVVNAAPDLVITGPSDRPTQAMLAAMGMPVTPSALSAISMRRCARRVRSAIGSAIPNAARRSRGAGAGRAKARAAFRIATHGAGDRARRLCGGSAEPRRRDACGRRIEPPPGAPSGYGGFVSLEQLLVMQPDILVLKDAPDQASDQGALFLTHPALACTLSAGAAHQSAGALHAVRRACAARRAGISGGLTDISFAHQMATVSP